MRRLALPLIVLGCVLPLAALPIACSDSSNPPAEEVDSGADLGLEDIPPWEAPELDSNDPLGRVLVLPLYDPAKRCVLPVTEIGNYDEAPDGGIAECGDLEVCYVRPDGILAYHNKDCVHPPNFKANWKREVYSELGPCEPIRNLQDTLVLKECPNSSCTFARDITIDTVKNCATAIKTKGCRETFGKPTSCFCDGAGNVFLPANPSASTTPPTGFTACPSSNTACSKALAIVDTVKGCDLPPPVDAGPDATDAADATDASDASGAASDAVTDEGSDAADSADAD